jgi:N-acetylglutamate synthase-like GNAT family acetyltransferase
MAHIRGAARQDGQAIRRLIRQVGINPIGLDWRRFLVAIDDQGALIGCGQIKPHGDGSNELASIAVAPAWQGLGIASALIWQLMDAHARSRPNTPLYLTCRASLEGFYTRFGFQMIGPEAMSPYFRRIFRLYHGMRSLFHLLPFRVGTRPMEELRVMRLKP